jgi:hypothetical protein
LTGGRRPRQTPGRRPFASPGREINGRGVRNLIRLRGGRVVRQRGRHVLMAYGDCLVTVPMLKGGVPHSTLRGLARALGETSGRSQRWRNLYT